MIDFATEQVCDTYTFLFHMGCACNQGTLMMGIGSATPVHFLNSEVIRLSSFEPSNNVVVENTLSATGFTSKVGSQGTNVQNSVTLCPSTIGNFSNSNVRNSVSMMGCPMVSSFNSTIGHGCVFESMTNSFSNRYKRDYNFVNTFASYDAHAFSCYVNDPRNTFSVRGRNFTNSLNSAILEVGANSSVDSSVIANGGGDIVNSLGGLCNDKNSVGFVSRILGDNTTNMYSVGTSLCTRNSGMILAYGTTMCCHCNVGMIGSQTPNQCHCNTSVFSRGCTNCNYTRYTDSLILHGSNGTDNSGVAQISHSSGANNVTNVTLLYQQNATVDDSVEGLAYVVRKCLLSTWGSTTNNQPYSFSKYIYNYAANTAVISSTETNCMLADGFNSAYFHNRCSTNTHCGRNSTSYYTADVNTCAPDSFNVSGYTTTPAASSVALVNYAGGYNGTEARTTYMANMFICNVPTSSAGLPTGHVWRCTADNTLRIVT